jgi:DNA invertase Pin-like site-specific DNA recombinase
MHHRAKLTDEQVRTIRRLYASGTIGYRLLAKAFKCSQWTIRDIVRYWTRAAA